MSAHEAVPPPSNWDAACSCGTLLRDSMRRSAATALVAHIEREGC